MSVLHFFAAIRHYRTALQKLLGFRWILHLNCRENTGKLKHSHPTIRLLVKLRRTSDKVKLIGKNTKVGNGTCKFGILVILSEKTSKPRAVKFPKVQRLESAKCVSFDRYIFHIHSTIRLCLDLIRANWSVSFEPWTASHSAAESTDIPETGLE